MLLAAGEKVSKLWNSVEAFSPALSVPSVIEKLLLPVTVVWVVPSGVGRFWAIALCFIDGSANAPHKLHNKHSDSSLIPCFNISLFAYP